MHEENSLVLLQVSCCLSYLCLIPNLTSLLIGHPRGNWAFGSWVWVYAWLLRFSMKHFYLGVACKQLKKYKSDAYTSWSGECDLWAWDGIRTSHLHFQKHPRWSWYTPKTQSCLSLLPHRCHWQHFYLRKIQRKHTPAPSFLIPTYCPSVLFSWFINSAREPAMCQTRH